MKTLTISTDRKRQIVDITKRVQEVIEKADVAEGMCTMFVMHTTAAITTADLDPGTDQDYLDAFEKLIPKLNYRHPHDPSHMPDHILSTLIGTSISVPFKKKKFMLGTWQRIVLIELDGARKRTIVVSCVACT